jgi:hypothetical protein
MLAVKSCDLTTFQMPLSTFCLTSVPMGWSNSVPIFHADVTIPFLDNAPIKGPPMQYEQPNGSYKTHSDNPGIHRFIWEHFQNLDRVVQHIKYIGCTWLGPKGFLCVPKTLIVGHMCYYKGRRAADSKVDKFCNWGPCNNLSEVRAFLSTASLMQIFIKNFLLIA